ncbi:MAG: LytS/YhcK type 5TM receptor domain-containing protein, partial [Candidatus Cloacimonadaceae bacterium]|nr:LytS/YhcK type 5TM receptor domain-containing protein [Candidatus Cloacimonadaceae bacterium]
MLIDVFLGLIANAAILLGLSVVHDLIILKPNKPHVFRQPLIGLLLGLIGLGLIGNPWVLGNGIIFDTRTILLSISGLFFGFVPTAIAVVMTA